jgi:hypothetical protein
MLILYLDFENKHDPIVEPIELQFLPNNQYIGPYSFTLVLLNFKQNCALIFPRDYYIYSNLAL